MNNEERKDKILRGLDQRDKIVRVFEIVILLIALGATLYSNVRLNTTVDRLDASVSEFQKGSLEARKANFQKQDDLKGYFKCLFLYQKKFPEFDFKAATYKEAEKVLDDCAATEN